ncbi:F-box protein At4g00893-like [Durio zibethinus]|uniref:F-box protein At4g00893-like n=1 Tax=Durio zibethinus TaxID=66656 RepID=A0A6P6AMT1_DURZI|nr:F-box protein At4g00893-like [Durio zibethinus]
MVWLLPELLHLVSSHLFAGDLAIFGAICKSWHSINVTRPPPPHNSQHNYPRSPYLLSLLDNGTCRFFHPQYKGIYQVHILELLGARIRFSKYGWLLLTRDDFSVLFFNPFTREKIELPHYPHDDGAFATMYFSLPPTSSSWFVIGIYQNGPCFGILNCGEDSWTLNELYTTETFFLSSCPPVLYEGQYYYMGRQGEVMAFDIYDTESEWTVLPKIHHRSNLIGSRDEECKTYAISRGFMQKMMAN